MKPLFLLIFLNAKLVSYLFWIRLVCAYQLGESETLRSLCFVTLRPVPQPDVSAANAVCTSNGILDEDCVLLTDVNRFS